MLRRLLEKMEPPHLSTLRLEALTLTRNMVIEVILPIGLVIQMVWIILAKVGQFRIISTFRGKSPIIFKIICPEGLIIKTDRQTTITMPPGDIGIDNKTITPKTEGFTHQKPDDRIPFRVGTRCHKGTIIDHNLLGPKIDRYIKIITLQEGIGADKKTLTLKTQGFTHKGKDPRVLSHKGTKGDKEKKVYHNLLQNKTDNLMSVGESDSMKVNIPKTKNKVSKTEKPHCGIGNEGFQTVHPTALLTSIEGTQINIDKVKEPKQAETKSKKTCNLKC